MAKTVRKATISDLTQLAELFNGYRIFYKKPPALDKASEFLKERLENEDSEIFVAIDERQMLCGFVQLYPIFSSVRLKRKWLLNDLFVDSKFRGMGISKILIDEAKALCRRTNACGLDLETSKSNEIGNQLYPRMGFVLNRESNFYDWTAD